MNIKTALNIAETFKDHDIKAQVIADVKGSYKVQVINARHPVNY